MNQWARGFFGRPTIDDWSRQLDFTTKLFRPRGLHLDDRHVAHADGSGFSASIVDATLYIVHNHRRLRTSGASLALYLPKIQTAEEAALWNDILVGPRAAPRASGRSDQGVRARRTDRGVLPVDGDPRRPRHALRWLQHGPLGLHQQRLGCDGMGPGVRQPEHRRHHDDLRLYAELRGPRASGRQYPGPAGTVCPLAGWHGAEHSGRVGGWRRERHEEGEWWRRARATRGRERQVGRSLEDGSHREAGVGESRPGQPARAGLSPAHVHACRRGRSHHARTGATNHSRRPRSCERGAPIRERLRPGAPGCRAQARGLLRQRRRAVPDGRHGDGRNPPQHPVGVAPQAARR